jgi:acyl carrier protein
MNNHQITIRLTQVFRELFENDSLELEETTTANDVAGWDSLTHIDLILAVEQEFKVKLTTREVRSMQNVGDFIRLIHSKLG